MAQDADPRIELAFSEAVRAVTQQQTSLDNLRQRSTTLLAAVAFVTSFLGGAVLARSGSSVALTVAALACVCATVVAVAVVTFPRWPWRFRLRPKSILENIEAGHSIDSMHRHLAEELEEYVEDNDRRLGVLQWAFAVGLISLGLEFILWAVNLAMTTGPAR